MKLLIAGSGFIVEDWLPLTKDLPQIELTAIDSTKRSEEKAKKLAKEYGIKERYADYEQALKETKADTVYVAVPNFLHYDFVKKALEAGKNVICEKPFTIKYDEFKELKELALKKDLVLLEAITNQYLTNYKELKDKLADIGPVKIVSMNYSQYSHRYDAFKEGKIQPVFDPKKGGGALMDLNIYNIHFIVGLFGMPKEVHYMANIQRDVDTSGILTMDYGDFKAVAIAAKDVGGPITSTIEGEKEALVVNGSPGVMDSFDIYHNSDKLGHVDDKVHAHRMYEEFVEFAKIIKNHDMEKVRKALEHSDHVMKVLQMACDDAGLKLG
ncbi:Gfo/Idh/MocA family oxidoreductase [Lactobacillus hamsteri]|uniref:Gfo Idh MocA family oxidoreductase n=1 Tax=Lactobacillus hamsteri DSM 5661 = JCM 6256 TaxID=1423754 RepID=A0A0R1YEZ5_9LACO|nr:Gfo/Idh/MocA family oxidoreductase [Lactobacillus hamsteri]KRM37484.1 gfo Idh MocA family oxidoreductase [Lactobacillus hamsteri DSM 5661 = JCM 6256]